MCELSEEEKKNKSSRGSLLFGEGGSRVCVFHVFSRPLSIGSSFVLTLFLFFTFIFFSVSFFVRSRIYYIQPQHVSCWGIQFLLSFETVYF